MLIEFGMNGVFVFSSKTRRSPAQLVRERWIQRPIPSWLAQLLDAVSLFVANGCAPSRNGAVLSLSVGPAD